ncbi:energy-coupling factor ABC transporter ATP-binding protein [Mesorhizobium sp. BR1-1-16]|uniref:energy-coupling factor ABC transporter ATP-binding protein n=1 Tax=Mesorhizobium sp. BR1-1-16 TaxID=2876653 RepID=UPI001CCEA3D2|nr:ABC transporter ATP-binding protein [Mesorhizobium sp. BR1-1-16]MBZ9939091.1 energy-coupling factor ABC transporter ATP-binding protein [Mesorhizobium sp. BR1-1-16]
MIALDAVSHDFDGRPVLAGISLSLAEQRIGIVGANGSGKSTFARLLNGLVIPRAGRVTIDGLDTAEDVKAVRRKVGFVFQNPDHQIVMPIVSEDLAFGLKARKVPKAEITERIDAALARYGLGHLRERPVHQLSGGEKQLVALSAVLVTDPDILVFDEPTTLLDLRNRNRVAAAIAALPHQAVLVSHDLDLVAACERVLMIEDGQIAADGAPGDVLPFYRERMQ